MSTGKMVKFIGNTELINSYLKDVRKHDVVSKEEEIALFKRYADGDMSAREQIILANQRFVYSQAKIYAVDEEDIMDYVSEGNIGLMEAIEEFDYTKGFKFITFAVWYIKRAMNSYMTNGKESIVKSNNAKYGKKIDKIKNEFFLKNGRFPYPNEIAEELLEKYNLEVVNIEDLYDLEISSISEESPRDDDASIEEVSDFAMKTADVNEFEKQESCDDDTIFLVDNFLDLFSGRNQKARDIIMKYFGIGTQQKSLAELCEEYQMHEEILKKDISTAIQYMSNMYDAEPSRFVLKTAE
jgi:RNA polymerase primary sigma factor